MKMTDDELNWGTEAPIAAMQAVVIAAEHAASSKVDASAAVMVDAEVDARWLMVAAVRSLAGLAVGPHASRVWEQLRSDAHELAAETGADDAQVRLVLVAIALAESYERGAVGRCEELVASSEFPPLDIAHAAAVMAGHLVLFLAGDHAGQVFGELFRRYGVTP